VVAEKPPRIVSVAKEHVRIAAIDRRTALSREPDGSWRHAGAGTVWVYIDEGVARGDLLTRLAAAAT
jgi:hypothetical protein